jgi:hypothetical protein
LMDEYWGDDDAALAANNTSAFNDRTVVGGTSISMHAFGLAIDLNPIQNPYVEHTAGKVTVAPEAGREYLDRKRVRPGMAEQVVSVFAEHGLTVWGGLWKNQTDYQHFQVSRTLANQLIRLPPTASRALFDDHVRKYGACMRVASARSCAQAD